MTDDEEPKQEPADRVPVALKRKKTKVVQVESYSQVRPGRLGVRRTVNVRTHPRRQEVNEDDTATAVAPGFLRKQASDWQRRRRVKRKADEQAEIDKQESKDLADFLEGSK